jgi:methylmalonyl-CoA/ethylmalonyl-CoA epimerase
MKIHHLGYAIKDINSGVLEFEKLGYKPGKVIDDSNRGVSIVFMSSGKYSVELIAPLTQSSPVRKMLQERGPSPYHICYEVENIEKEIKRLANDGWIIVENISNAIAIDNKLVAFLYKSTVGLIELLETGGHDV